MKLHFLICLILFSAISIFAQSETEKGVELYRNGDFNGAITILENVVKTDEKDRKAWLYLGVSLGKKGKDTDALKAFRKWDSIKLKPTTDTTEDSIETVKILSKPRVMSTEESRRNNTQGKIKLIVEFMANEKIGLVFALQTLPDGLTENCIAAAQQIKFKSEKKNGKPISVVKIIEYSFTLY